MFSAHRGGEVYAWHETVNFHHTGFRKLGPSAEDITRADVGLMEVWVEQTRWVAELMKFQLRQPGDLIMRLQPRLSNLLFTLFSKIRPDGYIVPTMCFANLAGAYLHLAWDKQIFISLDSANSGQVRKTLPVLKQISLKSEWNKQDG